MTHINEILQQLNPKTEHIVIMTTDNELSRELIHELRVSEGTGEGRVFFRGDTKISIVSAGDTYDEKVTNYSLLHWAWYNQPNAKLMGKVQEWERKATEILTR